MAYADFVTAMMAFFLVMWITAQSKPVKQAVAEYFEDPLGTNSGSRSTAIRGPEDATTVGNFQSGRGPGRSLAMANLKSKAIQNPAGVAATKPPRVLIARGNDTTRSTGTTIAFTAGTADLDDFAIQRLNNLIPLLLGKPNVVEIRGRLERQFAAASDDPSDEWELSYARCAAVRKFLTDSGLPSERIRLSQAGVYATADRSDRPSDATAPLGSFVEIFALSEYARNTDAAYDEQHLGEDPGRSAASGSPTTVEKHGASGSHEHETPH